MNIFTKFHEDWTKIEDFLAMANFWTRLVFFPSDFTLLNDHAVSTWRPLRQSAVFRAGNVVSDVGCHILPLKLQIAESATGRSALSVATAKVGLSKCPKVTARMKLAGLLTIQSSFLGIFTTSTMIVTKICSVILVTGLFCYWFFSGWKHGRCFIDRWKDTVCWGMI